MSSNTNTNKFIPPPVTDVSLYSHLINQQITNELTEKLARFGKIIRIVKVNGTMKSGLDAVINTNRINVAIQVGYKEPENTGIIKQIISIA